MRCCMKRCDLRDAAMQAVLDNINKDTFGSYLDVASSHRLERLEAKCIDYLLANFNKVYIS